MKVIITGSTGMVGKGVLLECIDDPGVEKILLVNRNPLQLSHPKIEEVIHKDFSDFYALKSKMKGYDVCCHCMGVSSVGMSESEFNKFTYEMSKALASVLYSIQPNMVFFYVSGMGTDSSEKGKVMWARVKGKTENMILNMGFKDAYVFRPGAIIPERGIQSRTKLYNMFYVIFRPFFPLMKRIKSVTTTSKVGRAMINLCRYPQEQKHIEGKDINKMALLE